MSDHFLVTGGAGFIGCNIARALLKKGHTVRVLDNFSTGKRENLADIATAIEIFEGDLADLSHCQKAVESIDYILHLGALPSVSRSVQYPMDSHRVNITGTLNLLLAARHAKVKRLVFSSSSSIYGDNPVLPKHEELTPAPISPYALSKLAGEHYCKIFTMQYGLETMCLRYFNVFGPYQNPFSEYAAVIPRFVCAYLAGERPVIYGDGLQTRDFTFIDYIVEANIQSCYVHKKFAGESMNVAVGNPITVLDLAQKIAKILNVHISPQHEKARLGDIKHSFADVKKINHILGLKFQDNLDECLEKTVNWFKNASSFIKN